MPCRAPLRFPSLSRARVPRSPMREPPPLDADPPPPVRLRSQTPSLPTKTSATALHPLSLWSLIAPGKVARRSTAPRSVPCKFQNPALLPLRRRVLLPLPPAFPSHWRESREWPHPRQSSSWIRRVAEQVLEPESEPQEQFYLAPSPSPAPHPSAGQATVRKPDLPCVPCIPFGTAVSSHSTSA